MSAPSPTCRAADCRDSGFVSGCVSGNVSYGMAMFNTIYMLPVYVWCVILMYCGLKYLSNSKTIFSLIKKFVRGISGTRKSALGGYLKSAVSETYYGAQAMKNSRNPFVTMMAFSSVLWWGSSLYEAGDDLVLPVVGLAFASLLAPVVTTFSGSTTLDSAVAGVFPATVIILLVYFMSILQVDEFNFVGSLLGTFFVLFIAFSVITYYGSPSSRQSWLGEDDDDDELVDTDDDESDDGGSRSGSGWRSSRRRRGRNGKRNKKKNGGYGGGGGGGAGRETKWMGWYMDAYAPAYRRTQRGRNKSDAVLQKHMTRDMNKALRSFKLATGSGETITIRKVTTRAMLDARAQIGF